MLRNFKKLVSLVLVLAISLVVSLPAFAAESSDSTSAYLSNSSEKAQIIGEYDGPLSKFSAPSNSSLSQYANVRINSYATYSKNDGIKVHVELYVPWYEFANPKFTSMSGTVSVLLNKKTTVKGFAKTAKQESTISTDVTTGVKGSSGNKGTVTVSGLATAVNALDNGGAFAISYEVTIP